jgi:ATP-dependent DNA ligase
MKWNTTVTDSASSVTVIACAWSRGGYNWTDRYPWIVESALKNRIRQFVIDGEAVVLGVDGISDFGALRSRQHDGEVQLYAFDILALDEYSAVGMRYST